MSRPRWIGYAAVLTASVLSICFIYGVFISFNIRDSLCGPVDLHSMSSAAYYSIVIPIGIITLFVLGTGFWIGWTIISIKVVPPMPEMVEKKDYSKIKAVFLCLLTFACFALFIYGVYIRSYWALAVPAAVISLVILGAVFWVGIAIITTRATLPDIKK